MSKSRKISPEAYRDILNSLVLRNIYLKELNAKFNEEFVSENLELDINERFSYKQEGQLLIIAYRYRLTAQNEQHEKPALEIKATYRVIYQVLDDKNVPDTFMKIFKDLTISLLLWTYFRELVGNMVYRMGLPPLVLPMKRVLTKK